MTQALAIAPAGTAADPTVISLAAGTYSGQITVSQPYTDLVGATGNPSDVVITGDISAGTAKPSGGTYGTSGSATVTNTADDTLFQDLTLQNTGDPTIPPTAQTGFQAVALLTAGDRQVYDDVRLLGQQDTLYVNSATATSTDRAYFYNSYIEGSVDFIFGRGTALFDRSTIHALNRVGGTVVAPDTYSANPDGFLFDQCRFISDTPAGGFQLGRAWPADTTAGQTSLGQTTIQNSWIDGGYAADPWIDWTTGVPWQTTSRFSVFDNSGPGAPAPANADSTGQTLTSAVSPVSWLAGSDAWDPIYPATSGPPATPTSLSATGGDGTAAVTWSRGSDPTIVGYDLYRVVGPGPVTATSGNLVNTSLVTSGSFDDSGLANGTEYTYAVAAVNASGVQSTLSASQSVTPSATPNITVATSAQLTAALAGAPGTSAYVIAVSPGTYTGPFTLTANDVTVTSTTGTASGVILTSASSAAGTATLAVSGTGDNVDGLTITQTGSDLGAGTPAVHTTGTQDVFDNDVLSGTDRVVWADSSYYATQSQQLYENTTVTGNTSLVLGRASAVFDGDTFDVAANSGVVLTASTASTFPGLLVINSTITPGSGITGVELGQPYIAYPNAYTPNSTGAAFVEDTVLDTGLNTSTPWTTGYDSNNNTNDAVFPSGRYGEFGNTGPGAAIPVPANRPQLGAVDDPATFLGTGWYTLPAPPPPAPTAISGTVTDSQTGAPIANVCAYLYTTAGVRTSDPGTCTTANGTYTMPVAAAGNYDVAFSDPSATFASGSVAVTVTSGQTVTANETLSPVAATAVSGTVTDSQTGAPIANVCAYLYTTAGVRTSDPGTCTTANGTYTMPVAAAGNYDVAFSDPSALHLTEWSGGSTTLSGAHPVQVVAGSTTTGVDAAMEPAVTTGIMGRVTAASSGVGLAGVCVYLYTTTGTRTADVGVCTNTGGYFVMPVATPGTYDVAFSDPAGGPVDASGNYYATQWSGGAAVQGAATSVTVVAGAATENIDAAMTGA